MNKLDVAIKICDSYPNEFPTEKEKWEHEKEFGKNKERKKTAVYLYEADVYFNYGSNQRFIENIKFYSVTSNPEAARKSWQNINKGQRSLKNVKLIKEIII